MKKVFFIITLCIVGNVFSQNQGTIVGKVSDIAMNDEPILFAQVQLKNSDHTAQTNFHGNFELADVSPGEYTLVFSFLGYESMEVAVQVKENETVRINGQLKTKMVEIDTAFEDELVVSQKTSNTTFQEKNPLQ